MKDNSDHSYLAHLEGMGHQRLTAPIIAGFDAWYKTVLPPDKNTAILDFGCGLGDFMEYLLLKGYKNIYGTDINSELVARSAKRTGRPVDLLVDIEEYSRKHQGQYDCLHLKDVLEHLDKPQTANYLRHLRIMLKPGGLIIVSAPQMCGFTSSFTLFNDFTHQSLYTERSLRYVLGAAGFEQIRLVHPQLPLTFRPTALALRVARTLWFMVIRLVYFIERPGEERPSYLSDRIMVTANRGAD